MEIKKNTIDNISSVINLSATHTVLTGLSDVGNLSFTGLARGTYFFTMSGDWYLERTRTASGVDNFAVLRVILTDASNLAYPNSGRQPIGFNEFGIGLAEDNGLAINFNSALNWVVTVTTSGSTVKVRSIQAGSNVASALIRQIASYNLTQFSYILLSRP